MGTRTVSSPACLLPPGDKCFLIPKNPSLSKQQGGQSDKQLSEDSCLFSLHMHAHARTHAHLHVSMPLTPWQQKMPVCIDCMSG